MDENPRRIHLYQSCVMRPDLQLACLVSLEHSASPLNGVNFAADILELSDGVNMIQEDVVRTTPLLEL